MCVCERTSCQCPTGKSPLTQNDPYDQDLGYWLIAEALIGTHEGTYIPDGLWRTSHPHHPLYTRILLLVAVVIHYST